MGVSAWRRGRDAAPSATGLVVARGTAPMTPAAEGLVFISSTRLSAADAGVLTRPGGSSDRLGKLQRSTPGEAAVSGLLHVRGRFAKSGRSWASTAGPYPAAWGNANCQTRVDSEPQASS